MKYAKATPFFIFIFMLLCTISHSACAEVSTVSCSIIEANALKPTQASRSFTPKSKYVRTCSDRESGKIILTGLSDVIASANGVCRFFEIDAKDSANYGSNNSSRMTSAISDGFAAIREKGSCPTQDTGSYFYTDVMSDDELLLLASSWKEVTSLDSLSLGAKEIAKKLVGIHNQLRVISITRVPDERPWWQRLFVKQNPEFMIMVEDQDHEHFGFELYLKSQKVNVLNVSEFVH